MRRKMNLKNRIEAVVLAALLVVTTLFTGQKIQASYSGIGSDYNSSVSSGGSIAQVLTSNAASYERIDGGKFKLHLMENQTVNYTISFYQNLTDINNPTSGERVCDINNAVPVTGSGEVEVTIPKPSKNNKDITIQKGETFSVVITLTSAAGNITFYKGTAAAGGGFQGFQKEASGGWSAMGVNMFDVDTTAVSTVSDIESITLNKENIYLEANSEETDTLTATLKPAYLRDITFNATGDSATVDNNGIVQAVSGKTGNTVISALAGGASASANVYVVKSEITGGTSFTYDGSDKTPDVTVTCGNALEKGTDYTVEYSDCKNAGTAKAVITGKGNYLGYTKTLEYTINPAEITQEMVNAATFGIDTATGNITSAVVGDLTFNQDFQAVAEQTGIGASGNPVYKITVTGIGNYAGDSLTRTGYEVSASADGAIDISTVINPKLQYSSVDFDGSQKKPSVTYYSTYGEENVIENFGENVNITYGENKNAGTGTVTITGKAENHYTGTIVKEFTINKQKISKVNISVTDADGKPVSTDGKGYFVHTGREIKPNVTLNISLGENEYYALKEGEDYTIQYVDNTDITESMRVHITGQGNFKSSKDIYFKIIGDFAKDPIVSVEDADSVSVKDGVAASGYSTTYSGGAKTPRVVIELGDVELDDTNYNLTYSNNINAGTAEILAEGKGIYAGKSFVITYTIDAKKMAGSLTIADKTRSFTGAEIVLPDEELVVVSGGTTLAKDTDYEVTYSNNINAGEATVTATGKGNYTGKLSNTFTISPVEITDSSDWVIKLNDTTDPLTFEYTGSQIKPSVTVEYAGNTLTENKDYTLGWANNLMVGTATVTVKGKGNVTGSVERNFEITTKGFEDVTFTVGGEAVTYDGTKYVTGYSATYIGRDIKPDVIVYDANGKKISTDYYRVSYSQNVNAGEATITIDGIGVYKDAQAVVTFTINKQSITDESISINKVGANEVREIDGKKYTYPSVEVMDSRLLFNKVLTEKTEAVPNGAYTITVGDEALESGEQKKATITGVGNYEGVYEMEYTIGTSLANASLTLKDPLNTSNEIVQAEDGYYYVDYMGENRPLPTLTLAGENLVQGEDYVVTYYSDTYGSSSNEDTYNTKGTFNQITATITGKGEYYGTKTYKYVMQPVSFNNVNKTFTFTDANDFEKTYDGAVVAPDLTVKYYDTVLVPGTDYELDTTNAGANVGTYTIKVNGKGNYSGAKALTYTVAQKTLEEGGFSIAEIAPQIYTGKAITPEVVVKNNSGDVLVKDVDYEVSYTGNIAVGDNTAKVIVTGIGNYKGTRDRSFSIITRDITDNELLTFSPIDNQTYTGSPLKPSFNVYYDGKQLTKGVDYNITGYVSNTKVGDATINIEGIGTFTGTNSTTFKIVGDITNTNLFTASPSLTAFTGKITNGNFSVVGLSASNFKVSYFGDTDTVSSDNYDISYICDYPGVCEVSIIGKGYLTGTTTVNINVKGSLEDAEVIGLSDYYNYTGSQIKPENFTVTYNGYVLEKGKDFDVEYTENVGPGTGVITVKPYGGNNNGVFTKSKVVNFTIKHDLANVTISGYEPSYKYTGSKIEPNVTVTGAPSGTYDIVYGTNTDAGKGTITVSPKSGMEQSVTGSKTVEFDIVGLDISGREGEYPAATVTGINPSYNYTGDLITPSVTLKMNGKTLVEGKDYTVTYVNNMSAGTATAKIIGSGNYNGAIEKTFTINKVDFANSGFEFTVPDIGYAGGKYVTPSVNVVYNNHTLTQGVDYQVSFTNNQYVSKTDTNPGQATATFTAIGDNFTGTREVKFDVIKVNLLGGTVSLEESSATYTGAEMVPVIKVTCPVGESGEIYQLVENTDYTITYNGSKDIKDAGDYNITVTGKGGFYNSLNTNFEVEPRSLDDTEWIVADIVENNDYTGSAVEPQVTVKNIKLSGSSQTLKEGTDYTVTYSNNVDAAGKDDDDAPTATITGIGNYGGTLNKTFNIGESIEGATVTISPDRFTYDGKAHVPSVYSVKLGDKLLAKGTDYEVLDVEDPVNAGTKYFKVKGIGNYFGTPSAEYIINQKIANMDKIRVVLDGLETDEDGNYYAVYNGSSFEPSVTVYDDSISTVEPLVEGHDYNIAYSNNTDVSTTSKARVTVTLTGDKNYAVGPNTKIVEFEIRQKDITDTFKINFENDRLPYTGSEITPVFTVDYNDGINPKQTLTSLDYDVELADNINAGTATVTVNAKGNYTGSVSKEFAIYADIANAQVSIPTQFYTGKAINPPADVVCGGNELEQDVDYDVTYSENDTQGVATITAKSAFYTGSKAVAYDIVFDPSLLSVEGYANEIVYTGSEIKPDFKVLMPNGEEIEYDADAVVYTDANGGDDVVNVGDITAEIPLTINGETQIVTANYKIVPKNINDCKVTQLLNNTYIGSALNPPVTIVYNNKELISGKEFTATYSNNTFPGAATVEVNGIGNFTGMKLMHFNIISPAVVSLSAKSQSTSAIQLSWTIFGEPTGYQICSEDCRVLYGTTSGNSYVVSGLDPQSTYTFKVRSYVVHGGSTSFGAWREITASTQISQVEASGTSTSTKKATISWNENTTVGGYELYRSDVASGNYKKIAVVPNSMTSFTDKNVKSGNTYYYIIRAYKKVDGVYVYGSYSDVMSITVK